MSKDIVSSSTPEELRQEIIELLGEPYQYARALLIHSETITLKRNWVAMYNLRDAFDHLRNAFFSIHIDQDLNKAKQETQEVYEHIRRAIVESAQDTPETLLYSIDKKRVNPHFFYKLAWIEVPDRIDIIETINSAKYQMELGRQKKSEFYEWKNVVKHYKEAEDILLKLEIKLPPKKDVYFRVLTFYGMVLGIFIALAVL